jgi:FkbM family methyltransferase
MLFLDKIKEKYPDIKNIFEIGAHRGYDIPEMVSVFPEANIYCFEADPFNYNICKNNCSKYDNVHVYNLAVYNQNKQMSFNRFCDIENIPDSETFDASNFQFTGCGSLHKPGVGLTEIYKIKDVVEEITVQAITLESFCKENGIDSIDALFMDVQGAEMNVILGCGDLMTTIKSLALEWSTKYTLYENETDFIHIKSYLESSVKLEEVAREYQLQGLNGDSLFLR